MDVEGRLTDVDFWLTRQQCQIQLPKGGTRPTWFKHVAQFLPVNSTWKCLEIGVVPGTTLLFLGTQCKYACMGIDFSPRVNQLRDVFTAQGVDARFVEADFLTWNPVEYFNLVYSCGFVEHFDDYHEVIEKHWLLVQPGGILLLTVPVLTPLQMWARKLFYKRSKLKEVLDSHNLEIMNLAKLHQEVDGLKHSEIVVSSYVGEMEFWFGPKTPGFRQWTRPFYWPVKNVDKLIRKTGYSSRWYSPMILVMARKVR